MSRYYYYVYYTVYTSKITQHIIIYYDYNAMSLSMY